MPSVPLILDVVTSGHSEEKKRNNPDETASFCFCSLADAQSRRAKRSKREGRAGRRLAHAERREIDAKRARTKRAFTVDSELLRNDAQLFVSVRLAFLIALCCLHGAAVPCDA